MNRIDLKARIVELQQLVINARKQRDEWQARALEQKFGSGRPKRMTLEAFDDRPRTA